MINTLNKFLDKTGFSRDDNHPSVSSLKREMNRLNISDDLKIDVMSFFKYDDSSVDFDAPVIRHFRDDNDNDGLSDYESTIKHFKD